MKYKLIDLITIKYGKNQKKVADENGNYPIIGTGGFMGWANGFLYDKPSVLIPRKGSISKVKYIDEPFWTVDTLFYSIINEDLVIPKYLYYKLSQIDLNHYNEGTTIPSLRTETLNRIELEILPLSEQENIVKVLDKLEEKITTNNIISSNLEDLSQVIFKRWFVDFEFPSENDEPFKSSGGMFVESELGEIPKGWKVQALDEIVDLIIDHRGKTPKKLGGGWSSTGYKAISAKNIKDNRIVRHNDIKYVNKELYQRWMKEPLKSQDIIMTSEAPLGELYFLVEKEEFCLSQRLYAIRANPQTILPSILYLFFNNVGIREQLFGRATGTTVTGIRQSELRKIKFLVPPMTLQKRLETIILGCLRKVYLNEKESKVLRNMSNTLLPGLMSGEIRITERKQEGEYV